MTKAEVLNLLQQNSDRRGNKRLNAAAVEVATAIGPIHFTDGDKRCEPMNVLKHLTSDYLRTKLGI